MITIVAHLNGGPYDDQIWTLPGLTELRISELPKPAWWLHPTEPSAVALLMRTGIYALRRNFAGEPVEHDLISYDYDWVGWEQTSS